MQQRLSEIDKINNNDERKLDTKLLRCIFKEIIKRLQQKANSKFDNISHPTFKIIMIISSINAIT